LIVSEPPNVWVVGVSGLFTRQFYRSAKAHLKAGGILSQWLPLYELEKDDFRIALVTLRTVFAHTSVWTNGSDAVVLASDQPLRVEPAQLAAKLQPAGVRADWALIGVAPENLAAFLEHPQFADASMESFLGGIDTVNVDDRPVLEFNTARNIFTFAKKHAGR